jgi:hypothetical protein
MQLLNQEFLVVNWRSLLRKVYSRHHDLADRVVVYICLTNDHGYASFVRNYNPVHSLFMIYHLVCNKSHTTGVTNTTGTAYTSGAPESLSCTRYGMVISRWRIVHRQKDRCEDFDYYRSLYVILVSMSYTFR